MKTAHRAGYILIFTLIISAAVMVIATYVATRSRMYIPFIHMALQREQAKMLALGGIECAFAQLLQPLKKKKSDTAEKKETASQSLPTKAPQSKKDNDQTESEGYSLLTMILPTINQWQEYSFTNQEDGIDATLKLCIMCEDGKININKIYDFEKKLFKGDTESANPETTQEEKLTQKNIKQTQKDEENPEENKSSKKWAREIQTICTALETMFNTKNLFASLSKMLKERTTQLNDITEVLRLKEFAPLKDALFFTPQSGSAPQLYLTDIFTVWSQSDLLEPWLLSHSLLMLLGIQSAQSDNDTMRKEKVEEWLTRFKDQTNWKEEWDTILAPVYGKELRSLPKNIDSFMHTSFDPRYFSVLVSAHVGDVTQRLYAIIERTKRSEKNNIMYTGTIKKLYWL